MGKNELMQIRENGTKKKIRNLNKHEGEGNEVNKCIVIK